MLTLTERRREKAVSIVEALCLRQPVAYLTLFSSSSFFFCIFFLAPKEAVQNYDKYDLERGMRNGQKKHERNRVVLLRTCKSGLITGQLFGMRPARRKTHLKTRHG